MFPYPENLHLVTKAVAIAEPFTVLAELQQAAELGHTPLQVAQAWLLQRSVGALIPVWGHPVIKQPPA